MSGRRRIVMIAAAVVAALALAAPFALRAYREQEAREVIARYDVLLAEALETLQPELIGEVAELDEVGRVGSYSTHLWGTGVLLESELLDLDILDLESAEPTVTVTVRERWRYLERDRRSGVVLGDEVEEEQTLEYTLVRVDGALRVYRSSLIETDGAVE